MGGFATVTSEMHHSVHVQTKVRDIIPMRDNTRAPCRSPFGVAVCWNSGMRQSTVSLHWLHTQCARDLWSPTLGMTTKVALKLTTYACTNRTYVMSKCFGSCGLRHQHVGSPCNYGNSQNRFTTFLPNVRSMYRWDRGDLMRYKDIIKSLNVSTLLSDSRSNIDEIADEICNVMLQALNIATPKARFYSFRKPYWDDTLKELHTIQKKNTDN